MMNAEQQRLDQATTGTVNWKRWGPYLAERQWGTVREDYSPHGTPWEYLPHDGRTDLQSGGAAADPG